MTTIGVDLGGTKILAGTVDDDKVSDTEKEPTPTGGPHAVAAQIAELVDALGGAKRIGLGAPGRVTGGELVDPPNLVGFEGSTDFAGLVAEACDLDRKHVLVENDVNVAAYGELKAGAATGHDDVLCVFMGTGVGGGVVLDGKLRQGPTGLAGEIGHTTFRDGGRRCGCGLLGHTEAYAGRRAMEAEARRRHATGEETELVAIAGDKRMKSGTFAKALARGDAVCMELLDQAVDAVAAAVASASMLVDLDLVVVGGGLADKLGPAFVGRIEEAVRSRSFDGSPLRAVPAALGDDAGVIGAALLAHDA